jgi:hypothetical protein
MAVLHMVDAGTGVAHLIRLEVAPLHRYSGRYPGLCGAEVMAASLCAGASGRCARCWSLAAPKTVPTPRPRWLPLVPFSAGSVDGGSS